MSDPNAAVKKRQLWLLGGAASVIVSLVVAGMFLFDGAPHKPREKIKTVSLTPPGTVEDKDAWRANEAAKNKANEQVLAESQSKLRQQDEQIKRLTKELEGIKATGSTVAAAGPNGTAARRTSTDEVSSRVLDAPLAATGQQVLSSPARTPVPPEAPTGSLNTPVQASQPGRAAAPPREAIEMISLAPQPSADGQAVVASAASPRPEVLGFPADERAKKIHYPDGTADQAAPIQFIPAGSFVRVAMLNGVDAPTGGQAQSNPLPMAFQVLDVANLANRYKLNIKDCRFIAAAWGDISSERTMGRTETLSCIINGETVEMAVKGQVIGEDGKAGIRGRLVTKQGQLLANALFAGTLSGIGKAFQSAATTTTTSSAGVTQSIDPDKVAQAGLGSGASQAATMLASYYLKAADKLYPVIETDGGRVVEILVTKGATYQGTASSRETYRGMLKRASSTTRSNEDD